MVKVVINPEMMCEESSVHVWKHVWSCSGFSPTVHKHVSWGWLGTWTGDLYALPWPYVWSAPAALYWAVATQMVRCWLPEEQVHFNVRSCSSSFTVAQAVESLREGHCNRSATASDCAQGPALWVSPAFHKSSPFLSVAAFMSSQDVQVAQCRRLICWRALKDDVPVWRK